MSSVGSGTVRSVGRNRATGFVLDYKAAPIRCASRILGAALVTTVALSGKVRAATPRVLNSYIVGATPGTGIGTGKIRAVTRVRATSFAVQFKATPVRPGIPRLKSIGLTVSEGSGIATGIARAGTPRLLGRGVIFEYKAGPVRNGTGRLTGTDFLSLFSASEILGVGRVNRATLTLPSVGLTASKVRAGTPRLRGQLISTVQASGRVRAGTPRVRGALSLLTPTSLNGAEVRPGILRLRGATLGFTTEVVLQGVLSELELWNDFEGAGGARLAEGGFIRGIAELEDVLRVDGDDSLSLAIPRSHPAVSRLTRGRVLRVTLGTGEIREWRIERTSRETGATEVVFRVYGVPPRRLLEATPIEQVDADGFVYTDVPVVQLDPSHILANVILRDAPSWFQPGTVTPTDREEIQFSRDNALSGLAKVEQLIACDTWLERQPGGVHLVHVGTMGAGAAVPRIRTGRDLVSLRREEGGDQVNDVRPTGAGSDDGPCTIGWAYWEVESVVSTTVRLKAIHGGAGPFTEDDQLISDGETLFLEKRDGTRTQITAIVAATQDVTVTSASTITTGDWVRLCRTSGGKHVARLRRPSAQTAGVRPGEFESPFDDTLNILKNPMATAWANPAARPDGWYGQAGYTLTKLTADQEWVTAGAALEVSGTASNGHVLAGISRSWHILPRRTTWSATAWIRLKSIAGAGHFLGFRVTRAGVVVGETLTFINPQQSWVQLKLEGLDLNTYASTTQTLAAEIVSVGAGAIDVVIDSLQLSPTLTARPITHGSNPARVWQQGNAWMDDRLETPVSLSMDLVDLARAGYDATVPLTLGGQILADDEEQGEVTARLVEQRRDLLRAEGTKVGISSQATRLRRKLSKPQALVIPFFEPVRVQTAERDRRVTALLIKATITATTDDEITVLLDVRDTLGGTPTVAYAAIGATYVSGSGSGPYVFTRPTSGDGMGRVVFTASLAGRSDVSDAVDVPEQPAGIDFCECRAIVQTVSGTQVNVMVTAVSTTGGIPTVTLVGITGTATLFSGPVIGVASPSGTAWIFDRGAFEAGAGQVQFRAELVGHQSDDDFLDIAERGRDTVALTTRARVISTTKTQVVVRVAVADPHPQGANSASIAYQSIGAGTPSPTSPQLVTPAATLTEAAGTYVDFTINRPSNQNGAARITFTATAANRTSDSDAVDIPEQMPTSPIQIRVERQSVTGTTIVYRVKVRIDANSSPENVSLGYSAQGASVSGPANPVTVAATNDWATTPSTDYTVTRPATDAGPGTVMWTGILAPFGQGSNTQTVPPEDLDVGSIVGTISTATGQFDFRLEGSQNTASWRYAVSTSAMPADATVDAAATTNGRSLNVTAAATLAVGGTVYVKARAYSGASGGGNGAGYLQAVFRRDTASAQKVVIVPAAAILPVDDQQQYRAFVGAFTLGGGTYPIADRYVFGARGGSTTALGQVPLSFAPGVTITQVRVNLYRQSASDIAEVRFSRINPPDELAEISVLAQSAGVAGWLSSGTISELVGANGYILKVRIVNGTATDFQAYFAAAEITYTAPTYEKTL